MNSGILEEVRQAPRDARQAFGTEIINSELTCYADIQPCEPQFLWYPYIRRSTLNAVRGNGETGKSTLIFALLAAITNGQQSPGMPGELRIDSPRNVIYLSREDGDGERRAALNRAGADVQRVYMPRRNDPTLADVERIQALIGMVNAAVIVFDPVQSFYPDGFNPNRKEQLRPLLDNLDRVCRETDCSLIFIEHLNKNCGTNNAYRGSGSQDWLDRCRSALMTGYLPDGGRVCGHLKSNGAPRGPAILYDIDESGVFHWQGENPAIRGEDVIPERPGYEAAKIRSLRGLPLAAILDRVLGRGNTWKGLPSALLPIAADLGVDLKDEQTPNGLTAEKMGRVLSHADIPGYRVAKGTRSNAGQTYSVTREVSTDEEA